ncbi:hypothetical protein PENSTE_c020G10151 [Penicillium steckii]|uniref:ATP phosphoribosyltransferase n=1 Tax=Penicillium steckii TaxID=303698 RepID=A0A1V6SV29_9EURO|nr:hypothetical protein PENSTE_c020G10151 [Penicillium steckii]
MSQRLCSTWSIARASSRQQISYYKPNPLRKIQTLAARPNVPAINILQRPGLSTPRRTSPTATFHPSHRKMSTDTPSNRYKLVFFVPTENAETCKEAIFATGAGSFPGGKYTKCCFQTIGTGQFLPNEGANPAIGAVGAVEKCEEARIEVMCLGREVMRNAVAALIQAHPYEEVAYEVYRMEDI